MCLQMAAKNQTSPPPGLETQDLVCYITCEDRIYVSHEM